MNKFIIFPLFFLSGLSIKNCISESTFKTNYASNLKGKDLLNLFKDGEFLGEGSFGKVMGVNWGGKQIAIKRINKPYDSFMTKIVEDELNFMKAMRGKDAGVEFIECVDLSGYLYIFQQRMFKDLESAITLLEYKGRDVEERIKIFKKILEKFSILHNEKIIHEDIKPENIMTLGKDLKDFRIIDFGMCSYKGQPVIGGSPVFNGYEKVGSLPDEADPRHDIYALGLVFAVLESKFGDVFSGLTNACFKSYYSDTCYRNIMSNVEIALNKSKMSKMIPIIKKATMYYMKDRYESVDKMIADIDKVLDSMDIENKKSVVEEDLSDLIKSKRAAEVETDGKKKFLNERNYRKQDAFIAQNEDLLKNKFNRGVNEGEKAEANPVLKDFQRKQNQQQEVAEKEQAKQPFNPALITDSQIQRIIDKNIPKEKRNQQADENAQKNKDVLDKGVNRQQVKVDTKQMFGIGSPTNQFKPDVVKNGVKDVPNLKNVPSKDEKQGVQPTTQGKPVVRFATNKENVENKIDVPQPTQNQGNRMERAVTLNTKPKTIEQNPPLKKINSGDDIKEREKKYSPIFDDKAKKQGVKPNDTKQQETNAVNKKIEEPVVTNGITNQREPKQPEKTKEKFEDIEPGKIQNFDFTAGGYKYTWDQIRGAYRKTPIDPLNTPRKRDSPYLKIDQPGWEKYIVMPKVKQEVSPYVIPIQNNWRIYV